MSPHTQDPRAGHYPQLSYRTSSTIDRHEPPLALPTRAARVVSPEISTSRTAHSIDNHSSVNLAKVTVKTLPQLPPTKSGLLQSSTSSPQPHKKKNSLFGTLFVKEASSAALDQVAAQLIAQHGELSPRAVPGVSSAKMPNFVPKVNTKWDGVPESVKTKEKQEKDRGRGFKRQSAVPVARAQSADSQNRKLTTGLRRRNSNSTLSSFDSRGGAADKYQMRQNNTSSSSQLILDLASSTTDRILESKDQSIFSKSVSTKADSSRSPSVASLPEITAFFPNDIPDSPAIPSRYQSNASKTSKAWSSKDATALVVNGRADSVIPSVTASSFVASEDRSPATPSPVETIVQKCSANPPSRASNSQGVVLVSHGANVLGPPVRQRPKTRFAATGAFLAGEAQLFELPEDNMSQGAELASRERKNSRAGIAPAPAWEAHANVHEPPVGQIPTDSRPALTKTKAPYAATRFAKAKAIR